MNKDIKLVKITEDLHQGDRYTKKTSFDSAVVEGSPGRHLFF
jgi:hypothetical protein